MSVAAAVTLSSPPSAWRRSTYGRAFLSIREDEIAAEAVGVNTTRYKVWAFVISAFFAGVAGALRTTAGVQLQPDGARVPENTSTSSSWWCWRARIDLRRGDRRNGQTVLLESLRTFEVSLFALMADIAAIVLALTVLIGRRGQSGREMRRRCHRRNCGAVSPVRGDRRRTLRRGLDQAARAARSATRHGSATTG